MEGVPIEGMVEMEGVGDKEWMAGVKGETSHS